MTFQFSRDKQTDYLTIARMLYEKVPMQQICRELKTSGKIVGMVKKLMDSNLISIDEETNEPTFSASLEEVEAFLDELQWQKTGKRMVKTPTVSAAEAVDSVIKAETAKEATERTSQYMQIGKVTAQAYWKWCQKMGIPLEEAVKHDIGKIVKEALEFHAEGKNLQNRVAQLEDALRMLSKEVDPIMRLKSASALVVQFLEFATLAEIVGFEIEGSPLVKHYENLITSYLKGEYA